MTTTLPGFLTLHNTSIGKKVIMAITGLIWVGFVFFHMYGNTKAFGGAEYFNHYAEGLRQVGAPIFGRLHLLTVARSVLTISVLAHIWAAYTLAQQARKARPQEYMVKKTVQATRASMTIRYGAIAIVLFLVYHLAHFTWGWVHPEFIPGDPYHNLVTGFQFLPNVAIYLVALAALGMHLYHGTWSMFQTLGLNNARTTGLIRLFALVLAVITAVGFATVPLAVMVGIIK
jgi:succinate dehydrogenase / fumarate reductase, cytochrome b subunit